MTSETAFEMAASSIRFGAGLGTIGATIFLVLWPIVGALVCGGAAAMRARPYAAGP